MFVFFIRFIMPHSQLHFISTRKMTGYPVRLSFDRPHIPHSKNSTETYTFSSCCYSVYHEYFCTIHTISVLVQMGLHDDDIREAVDRIKLHLVPQVSIPGTYCMRCCPRITVNRMLRWECFVFFVSKVGVLRYSWGFDGEYSWDCKLVRRVEFILLLDRNSIKQWEYNHTLFSNSSHVCFKFLDQWVKVEEYR